MKLVTFQIDGQVGAGLIVDDQISVCELGESAESALLSLCGREAKDVQAWAKNEIKRISLGSVRLLAPIPVPRRDIFCVGKNYYEHAKEFHSSGFDSSSKDAVPKYPIIFTKPTTSVIGPGESVNSALDVTQSVDYEGELGVVIGRRTFKAEKSEAMASVFGYTIINDVTSRELQKRHGQWVIGKGIDTFCPMGPWLVTADEIEELTKLQLTTTVNGEKRQEACLADLIFDIPTLITTLSATTTLLPGDIIATGTPVGVGIGFTPPKYLQPGDQMTVSITGLGELHNPVS
jgi:2-keto-4-pentenoate hydratase/2-oxohepta-3-ene-1,7-dioic acid hydratase in catechol pathway